jgi:predicted transcriptional regulator/ribosome-associated translation inhibitor RaiA
MEITSAIREDFLIIDDEATVSQMIGQLHQYEKRAALIFRKKKFLGLIEKKRLLRAHLDSKHTRLRRFVQKTPILSEHAGILETAYLLFQSNLDYIPVEREKQIVGVLRGLDVAALAMALKETKEWKVSDCKIVKSGNVQKSDSLSKVLTLMYRKRVDHVPVFDKGELYGIISYKDILRKYLNWSPKRDHSSKFNKMATTKSAQVDVVKLASLPVSNFCTTENLLQINCDASLKEAIMRLVERSLNDIIVMDGKKAVGLLTVKNILREVGNLHVPQNYNIKFVGLSRARLDTYEKDNIRKIAANEAFKLQRKIKDKFFLRLHLKAYQKEGKQQKYSVHLRVEYPGQILTSEEDDWDVIVAVRKLFTNAKNALDSRTQRR